MARVVILGAGLDGLAAACRLTVRGHSVSVVAATVPAPDHAAPAGFQFDPLGSVISLPAVLRDLFVKTGAPLADCLEVIPASSGRQFHLPGGRSLKMPPVGVGASVRAVADFLGPDAGRRWQDQLALGSRYWQELRAPAPDPDWDPPDATAPRPSDTRPKVPWRRRPDPVAGLVAAYAISAGPAMGAITYPPAPSDGARVLAGAVLPYVEATFGLWEVVGGVSRVLTELADRAVHLGATMATAGQAVITGQQAGATVRLDDGSTLTADLVAVSRRPGLRIDLGIGLGGTPLGFGTGFGPDSDGAATRDPRPERRSAAWQEVRAAVPADIGPADGQHAWLAPHRDRPRMGGGFPIEVVISRARWAAPAGWAAWTIRSPVPAGDHAATEDLLAELAERGLDIRTQLAWPAPAPSLARWQGGAALAPAILPLARARNLSARGSQAVAWAGVAGRDWAGTFGEALAGEVLAAHLGRAR